MAKNKNKSTSGFSPIEEGFLYKPVSERGSLVILLPSKYRDSQVVIKDSSGKVLERGVSHGYANGDREHFRFNSEGGKYPNGAIIEVTRADGSVVQHRVNNTSARMELGGSGDTGGAMPPMSPAAGIYGGSSPGIERPKTKFNFGQDDKSYTYKSPLSVLETIRSVSNIVSGAAKSFNTLNASFVSDVKTPLADFFENKANDAQASEGDQLTAIPGYNTEKG